MKKDRDLSELLEKARESLEVAVELYTGSHYDFSASRSYYAMFYTTQALLLTKNLSFSKHKAVISVFGKEFVKTRLLAGKTAIASGIEVAVPAFRFISRRGCIVTIRQMKFGENTL